ncbi:hypothetical protein ACFTUC_34970 [Streptomyces sp. NPDC056944]|uniref:hypothetical protein n=1 Tax=Streptomyces sp. NPDC056944 TaxID=3345972 RepID=UPI00363D1F4D
MADAPPTPTPVAADPTSSAPAFVDEAVTAAEGTRSTARWIASSLGAIPSLAVLASVVRAPGDAGFDPAKLALGVGLAALGALVGVLGFARVLAPVPLQDVDLRDLELTRIPGQPYTTFADLDQSLQEMRTAASRMEPEARQSRGAAKAADADAQQAEAAATAAELAAEAAPGSEALRRHADETRADATRKRILASDRTREAEAKEASLAGWRDQASRRVAIRHDAYRLKATDVVGRRYRDALIAGVVSVGAIAAGVTLLGLAPEPKETVHLPRLVTLTLNDAGQKILGCSARSLQALQTGGSTSAPTVITLPTPECPARTVEFATEPPQPLGTVTVAPDDKAP